MDQLFLLFLMVNTKQMLTKNGKHQDIQRYKNEEIQEDDPRVDYQVYCDHGDEDQKSLSIETERGDH